MTKRQQHYFDIFIQTNNPKSLYDVYKKPSDYKITEWKRIESGCMSVKGFHFSTQKIPTLNQENHPDESLRIKTKHPPKFWVSVIHKRHNKYLQRRKKNEILKR